jgi:anti-sigma-K factor RskA
VAGKIKASEPAGDWFWVAKIYRLIGDIHRGLGDQAAAIQAWQNAYSAFPKGIAELPVEMDEHAVILERLGRRAEAQERTRRLDQMGYRFRQA